MSLQAQAKLLCIQQDTRKGKALVRRIIQRTTRPTWMQPDRTYRDRL